MDQIFFLLMLAAMAAVVATLFAGVFSMVRDAPEKRQSNRLMRWRVLLQGVALALLALAMLTSGS